MNRRLRWLLLLGIVCLGGFLRFYGLGENPVSTYWDETAIGYDAYALRQTGRDMHGNQGWEVIFPSYGDYKLPLYIWTTSFFTGLIGPGPAAIRLTAAVSGTLLIVVMYGLGTVVMDRRLGMVSALMIAVFPWAIHFSRSGFEASLGMFCMAVVLLLLYSGRRKPVWFVLAGVVGALGVYAYFSVRYVVPLVMVLFGLVYFRELHRRHLMYFVGSILAFGLLLIPIYRSDLYTATNQFRLSTTSLLNTDDHILAQNIAREQAGNSAISRVIYHRNVFLAQRLIKNIATHLEMPYLFFWGDSNLRHGTGEVGLAYVGLMFGLVAGIYSLWWRDRRLLVFLVGVWLIALIPASVPVDVPHALRSLNALPALVLLIAMGILYIWDGQHLCSRAVRVRMVGLLVVSGGLYVHDYWAHYPARSAYDWQYGYAQLSNALDMVRDDYRRIIVTNNDGRMFLYPLLYNRVDPAELSGRSEDYQFAAYQGYEFREIHDYDVSKLENDILFVMTPEEYSRLDEPYPVMQTLYDYAGEVQFILIDTNQVRARL